MDSGRGTALGHSSLNLVRMDVHFISDSNQPNAWSEFPRAVTKQMYAFESWNLSLQRGPELPVPLEMVNTPASLKLARMRDIYIYIYIYVGCRIWKPNWGLFCVCKWKLESIFILKSRVKVQEVSSNASRPEKFHHISHSYNLWFGMKWHLPIIIQPCLGIHH